MYQVATNAAAFSRIGSSSVLENEMRRMRRATNARKLRLVFRTSQITASLQRTHFLPVSFWPRMPRKRCASVSSLDEYPSEEKYMKDDADGRAPRNAANARERARMRILSKAFCKLKTTLPWIPADSKLSKLDTLRLAATYIAHLRAVLRDDGEAHPETTKSLSLALSWPFAIQSNNAATLTNNSCNVSSSTSSSCNQYRGQQTPHDIQNFHHSGHQGAPARHNQEQQFSYY
ncbi:hypothetical protein PUN28_005463 [Cardiocondyla obscurior]|uniref:BHLH domain-containing protein n=2 Tax=Cardiocondyla obscurior TaxID=286306 RepID=A0AAW2GJB7_9HYME